MLSKKDCKKAMSLHIRILAILSEHMSVYFCQIWSILVMTSFLRTAQWVRYGWVRYPCCKVVTPKKIEQLVDVICHDFWQIKGHNGCKFKFDHSTQRDLNRIDIPGQSPKNQWPNTSWFERSKVRFSDGLWALFFVGFYMVWNNLACWGLWLLLQGGAPGR